MLPSTQPGVRGARRGETHHADLAVEIDVEIARDGPEYRGGRITETYGGVTWVPAISGIIDFTGRFELAISPVNTDYIFASAEGASHSELWVSWDGGANWNRTLESGSEPNWLGAQGWYDPWGGGLSIMDAPGIRAMFKMAATICHRQIPAR